MEYDRTADFNKIFIMLIPFLNEQRRRLIAGAMAKIVGFGGISFVSAATGVSRRAIARGIEELDNPVPSTLIAFANRALAVKRPLIQIRR